MGRMKELWTEMMYDVCPACGDYIDYCIGHPEEAAHQIFDLHDSGIHNICHPNAECREEV